MNTQAQLRRKLAPEAAAGNERRVLDGTYAKYMRGHGLDIGYRGEHGTETIQSVTAGAIGVDLNYPGYDGVVLPFPDASQDFVFASHILEHVQVPSAAIAEWVRVLKPGGALIVAVPHMDLYERRERPPSRWNLGHIRFYRCHHVLREIEDALPPRTFVIDRCRTVEYNYDYATPPEQHAQGRYEIECIVRKL